MTDVFILCFSLLVLLAAGAEIILRRRGVHPWKPPASKVRYEPTGKFFEADPLLGWRHLEGSFLVHLSETFFFKCTHTAAGLRVTNASNSAPCPVSSRPKIWVFGCSHTHGWSVNDEQTYPWLLQARMRDFEIVNHGMDGYGTVQCYLKCQQALHNGEKPALVILSYGAFHDVRNTFTRSWRKMIVPTNKLGRLRVPCARLGRRGTLAFKTSRLTYRPIPLMTYSSLAHRMEDLFNALQDRYHHSAEVTQAVVREFHALCVDNDVPFIVTAIWSPGLDRMASFCREKAIPFVDISVGTGRAFPEHHNWPHDPHPSPVAHKKYADNLYAHLSKWHAGQFPPVPTRGDAPVHSLTSA